MKKALGLLGATAIASFGVLAIGGTSFADPGDSVWVKCATTNVSTDNRPNADDCDATKVTVLSDTSVKFTGSPVNIEALVFNHAVSAGDKITFKHNADADVCGGGAPRVYVTIGGSVLNTADAAEPCGGTPGGDGFRTVEYTLTQGGTPTANVIGGWDVAAAGVVFDNGKAADVTVKDIVIAGIEVDFNAVVPQPTTVSPSPTTVSPSPVTPSPTTVSPTPTPTEPRDCEAYLYTGTTGNLCDRFANVEPENCGDVRYRVTLPDYRNDPWGLDGVPGEAYTGVRGVGCEANPLKPTSTTTAPVPSTSTSPVAGGGDLPVTGERNGGKLIAITATGLLAVAIGGIALVLVRKRREADLIEE